MKKKGLILDLEETVITTKSGEKYAVDEGDWKFCPKILDKIKFYADEGYIVCITSNQGGVEMGKITKEAIERKLLNVAQEIESVIRADVHVAYCPSMTGYHRKPNPGQAYTLALELELDLHESIAVSYFKTDKEFADNAGIGTFMFNSDFTEYYR